MRTNSPTPYNVQMEDIAEDTAVEMMKNTSNMTLSFLEKGSLNQLVPK